MSSMRWIFLLTLMIGVYKSDAVEAVAACTVFHRTARNGSDSAFAEISWQIVPSSLHYRKTTEGTLISEIETAVSIYNDTGMLTRDRFTLQTLPMQPGDAAKQKITELRRYALPPGKWNIRLLLGEQAFPNDAFIYNDSANFEALKLPAVSQIQLLDTFFESKVPSPFLKNGAQQLPLPLSFLDNGRRQLHFYAERYPTPDAPLQISYFFISRKPMEAPIYEIGYVDTLKPSSGVVSPLLHTFDVSRLATGNYYVNGLIRDAAGTRLASASTFFQIVNKSPDRSPLHPGDTLKISDVKETGNYFNIGTTFVSKYNNEQLRSILKMILPQADANEGATIINFFKRPDELYMRYFIYNYFGKFNKANPEQAWKEFSDMIRAVNRDFNAGGKMGFETDRGVIQLKYGKPDERIRVPNESGAVPYEIWRYNTVGKTSQIGLFLFYQAGVGSDYQLLHSTAPGERYNPSWRNLLYSTGAASGMGNSRAEQYFGNN